MSINVYPEPINNGDPDIWGPKELNQNRLSLGLNTCRLYDDAGTLKLSIGEFGLVTPSRYQKIQVDAAVSISLAGLTASKWAKIECAVSALVASISITSLTGANAAIIPTVFASAYSGLKGGFYIDTSKRCLGLVWIDSGGLLDGVINQLQAKDGYAGYSNSSANNFLVIDGLNMIGAYAYRNLGGSISYDSTNSQFSLSHKTALRRPILYAERRFNSGTNGGDATSGAWLSYINNTSIENTIVGASIDTGTGIITLPAGTYRIEAMAVFFQTNRSILRLYNNDSATELKTGLAVNAASTGAEALPSILKYKLVIAVATNILTQYQVSTTNAGDGLGIDAGLGSVNVYGSIEIIQEIIG
jgi:hypothetical protein